MNPADRLREQLRRATLAFRGKTVQVKVGDLPDRPLPLPTALSLSAYNVVWHVKATRNQGRDHLVSFRTHEKSEDVTGFGDDKRQYAVVGHTYRVSCLCGEEWELLSERDMRWALKQYILLIQ